MKTGAGDQRSNTGPADTTTTPPGSDPSGVVVSMRQGLEQEESLTGKEQGPASDQVADVAELNPVLRAARNDPGIGEVFAVTPEVPAGYRPSTYVIAEQLGAHTPYQPAGKPYRLLTFTDQEAVQASRPESVRAGLDRMSLPAHLPVESCLPEIAEYAAEHNIADPDAFAATTAQLVHLSVPAIVPRLAEQPGPERVADILEAVPNVLQPVPDGGFVLTVPGVDNSGWDLHRYAIVPNPNPVYAAPELWSRNDAWESVQLDGPPGKETISDSTALLKAAVSAVSGNVMVTEFIEYGAAPTDAELATGMKGTIADGHAVILERKPQRGEMPAGWEQHIEADDARPVLLKAASDDGIIVQNTHGAEERISWPELRTEFRDTYFRTADERWFSLLGDNTAQSGPGGYFPQVQDRLPPAKPNGLFSHWGRSRSRE